MKIFESKAFSESDDDRDDESGALFIISGTVADMMVAKRALYAIAGEDESECSLTVLGTAGMCRKANPLDKKGIPDESGSRAEVLEDTHPNRKSGFLIEADCMVETAACIADQMRWTKLPVRARTVLVSLVENLSGGRVHCPTKVIPRDTRQSDGSLPSITRGPAHRSKADAPIHVLVARSRRVEIQNGKIVFHPKAEPHYDSSEPDEPAFPLAQAAVHVVAIDRAGWGWDGVVLGPEQQIDVNTLIDHWVANAQKLFGRSLAKEDFIFADHDSGLFDRQIAPKFEERSDHLASYRESPWGRMLEWEHILVCLPRISPFYGDFTAVAEAMKMLGALWADQAIKTQTTAAVDWSNINGGYSRDTGIIQFTDSILVALTPIYEAIATARSGRPSTTPTWDATRFRARKRIPESIIGTLEIADFAVHDWTERDGVPGRIPVPLERVHGGGSHLCATNWRLMFRHRSTTITVPVFQAFEFRKSDGGKEYASEGLFFVRNSDIGRKLPQLYSPDAASKAAGVSGVPDFLDRLVATAAKPLNVADALFARPGAIAMASRNPYFGTEIVYGVVTDDLSQSGYAVTGIAGNKGDPGVCVSLSHMTRGDGNGHLRSVLPAGFIRFPIVSGTVDWEGVFPGFTRCNALADELMLRLVSKHGARVESWFSNKGKQQLTTKGRAVGSGCTVNDIVHRAGKRILKSSQRFCSSEDASAYFN
jgi:hypothetical protein